MRSGADLWEDLARQYERLEEIRSRYLLGTLGKDSTRQ
jgi:hypothetical protein